VVGCGDVSKFFGGLFLSKRGGWGRGWGGFWGGGGKIEVLWL